MKKTRRKAGVLAGALFVLLCMEQLSMTATRQEAVWITRSLINRSSTLETILNWDDPDVALVRLENDRAMYYLMPRPLHFPRQLEGRKVWIVTYHTTRDPVIGPIRIYVDYCSGRVLGAGPRM